MRRRARLTEKKIIKSKIVRNIKDDRLNSEVEFNSRLKTSMSGSRVQCVAVCSLRPLCKLATASWKAFYCTCTMAIGKMSIDDSSYWFEFCDDSFSDSIATFCVCELDIVWKGFIFPRKIGLSSSFIHVLTTPIFIIL